MSMKRTELAFTAVLLPLDFLSILLATIVATSLRTSVDILPLTESRTSNIGFDFLWWFFPILVLFFTINRLYILFELRHRVLQLFRIISSAGAASMLLFMAVLIGRTPFIVNRSIGWSNWAYNTSLLTVFYLWLSIILVVTLVRWTYRSILHALFEQGIACKRVLLVGNTEVAATLLASIKGDHSLGYNVTGVVKTWDSGPVELQTIGDLDDLKSIVQHTRPDHIITTDPELKYDKVLAIIDIANDYHIDFTFAPNLFEVLATNVTVSSIGGIPLLNLRRTSLDGWGKILKRLMDIGVSAVLLIVLSPIFLLTAILIKLQDGGPILFAQKRLSVSRHFAILKFRSMKVGAENEEDRLRAESNERGDGPLFKMKNDPRVTPLGRVLRKTRIDELPQLFNVLKGDMSLIGPRPHLMKEVEQYQKHHRKVLAIKPGMTGLAQLSGSSDLSFEEEVRLDTYYIENWSLIKDLEILLKTPFIILFKDRSGV